MAPLRAPQMNLPQIPLDDPSPNEKKIENFFLKNSLPGVSIGSIVKKNY